MDFRDVRRTVITAMFSDDVLYEKFVLKGGNALDIVHGLGGRASLDIDLSIEEDFENLEEVKSRMLKALADRFDSAGFVVFDFTFGRKPPEPPPNNPEWGGYFAEFKIIEKTAHQKFAADSNALRRNATTIARGDKRKFRIEVSKHEYCTGKQKVELDDFTIYVYSLPMIAVEKLRAICQQMNEYALRLHPTARARDFFDIHAILSQGNVDLTHPDTLELIIRMFAAKSVPIELLARIGQYRAFHAIDWPSVVDSVSREVRDFDYYFDYVISKVNQLEALWKE